MKREDFLKKIQEDDRVECIWFASKCYNIRLKDNWYYPTYDNLVTFSFWSLTTMAEVESFLEKTLEIVGDFEKIKELYMYQRELKYRLTNKISELGALEIKTRNIKSDIPIVEEEIQNIEVKIKELNKC
ncbi:MAG: hypothetical protein ACRCYA_05555 [Cetobacterium sp.]|uniref:hypothetical protein n=1 Tax=Cetobacterium sp. TaxID=2071632 RepID=UPI003EE6E5E7